MSWVSNRAQILRGWVDRGGELLLYRRSARATIAGGEVYTPDPTTEKCGHCL